MKKRIEWTDDMSVRIDVIDEDHKRLIALLNFYMEAVDDDEGAIVFSNIFQAFLDYTTYHFSREETMLAAAGYADLDTHRQSHLGIIEQLDFMHSNVMMSASSDMQDEVREFLLNWLRIHILVKDKAYSETVRLHLEAAA